MARYVTHLLIAFSQALNVLLGGWPDESLSSRSHRLQATGRLWRAVRRLINAAFFWQDDHCLNAHRNERMRYQSPPQLRRHK